MELIRLYEIIGLVARNLILLHVHNNDTYRPVHTSSLISASWCVFFHVFLSSFLNLQKIFLEKHFVRPDQGPNAFQMLWADDISRQTFK